MTTPAGSESVRAAGANADRLLLIGSGIAVGYGETSHDFALAGQLARGLSALTGRGTQVDVLVTTDLARAEVTALLDKRRLLSFDAVVTTPAGIESMRSSSGRSRAIGELLHRVRENAPESVHIFVVGLPLVSELTGRNGVLVRLQDATSRSVNRKLERLCLVQRNTTFVPFVPRELVAAGDTAGRQGVASGSVASSRYHDWARMIAPHLLAALEPSSANIVERAS